MHCSCLGHLVDLIHYHLNSIRADLIFHLGLMLVLSLSLGLGSYVVGLFPQEINFLLYINFSSNDENSSLKN